MINIARCRRRHRLVVSALFDRGGSLSRSPPKKPSSSAPLTPTLSTPTGAAAQDPAKGKVATATWFPKLGATAASALPAGEVHTVVIAARNEGKEPYTLAAVAGGVHTADFQHRVQNFSRTVRERERHVLLAAEPAPPRPALTLASSSPPPTPPPPKNKQLIGDELAPGQEMSLEYAFYLDPILAGRDYGVAIALIYTEGKGEEAKPLMSVAFNATVDVTEPPRLVDTEAIFMFAVLAALAALAAYFSYAAVAERLGLPAPGVLLGAAQGGGKAGGKATGAGGAGGASAAAARKAAAKKADDDDEWVKGTSYDLAKRKRQGATARVRAAAE